MLTLFQRTYRMFRTLGLRHLCVINKHNQILGIVTRSDLVSAHFLSEDRSEVKKTTSGSANSSSSRRKRSNRTVNDFTEDDDENM